MLIGRGRKLREIAVLNVIRPKGWGQRQANADLSFRSHENACYDDLCK